MGQGRAIVRMRIWSWSDISCVGVRVGGYGHISCIRIYHHVVYKTCSGNIQNSYTKNSLVSPSVVSSSQVAVFHSIRLQLRHSFHFSDIAKHLYT